MNLIEDQVRKRVYVQLLNEAYDKVEILIMDKVHRQISNEISEQVRRKINLQISNRSLFNQVKENI